MTSQRLWTNLFTVERFFTADEEVCIYMPFRRIDFLTGCFQGLVDLKWLVVIPKRECHDGQRHNNGDEILYWKNAAFDMMLREACVCKRDMPKCVRIRLWPVRRDDSSRVLIGTGGTWALWLARARVGFWRAREQRSIARAQGLAAVCRRLLQTYICLSVYQDC